MVEDSKFVVKVFVTLSDNSTGSFSFSYDCIPVPATRRQIPDPVIHNPAFETALEQFLVYVNSESSTQLKVLYYTIAIVTYNDCGYDPIKGGCSCCQCTASSEYECGSLQTCGVTPVFECSGPNTPVCYYNNGLVN